MSGSKARERAQQALEAAQSQQPTGPVEPSELAVETDKTVSVDGTIETAEDVDPLDEDELDLSPVVLNEYNEGYPRPERLEMYRGMYSTFHRDNPKKMSGKMPPFKIQAITKLVQKLKERRKQANYDLTEIRMLDYGSGKGYQYLKQRAHDSWGILPYCYDPGVMQLWERPQGDFDGIICTDVMEHLETEDVIDTLRDIFDYTPPDRPSFVYLHICCRPASKHFKDGRNVHLTVETPKWWEHVLQPFKDHYPLVHVATSYEVAESKD